MISYILGPSFSSLLDLLRLANENPRRGYSKVHGEVLKRRWLPPALPQARRGSSWRTCLGHYQDQRLAGDCFTVATVWLKTLYVRFFLELGTTRRVHCAGCTASPTWAWVTGYPQGVARQMSGTIQDEALPIRFRIHDRDATFPVCFDHVFEADDVRILRTPFRSPRANAFAERWVRSVRAACLERVLIMGERHLSRVLNEYVSYFNEARPGTLRV